MIVAYLLLGRLITWAVSIAKPTQRLWVLFEGCDFCLGVWVYFVLTPWFEPRFLDPVPYVPVVYELATSLLASFVMHVLRIGWQVKFAAGSSWDKE
jgi:hypothetical protein